MSLKVKEKPVICRPPAIKIVFDDQNRSRRTGLGKKMIPAITENNQVMGTADKPKTGFNRNQHWPPCVNRLLQK